MLLSKPRCIRVMTTRVRASAVCLPLNDRNVECVCTEGRINFFHSVLYMSPCFPLSYLENHCNLFSPQIEDLDVFFHHYLNLNPHLSYIGRVFALTSVPAVCHFSTFSLRMCPSFLLSVTAGLGDRVFISQRGTGGDRRRLGDARKMSLFGCALLSDAVYTAAMIFSYPPSVALLLCLPGIRNGK